MAKKKTLKKKTSDKKQSNLAETLVGSANEIWLAGLGAFAKAQQEGKKVYEKLVSEGKDFENIFKKVPRKAVDEVKSSVGSAKKRAAESWEKLEGVFEKRVEKALKGLGVPTSSDMQQLVKRIDALADEVNNLVEKKVAAAKNSSDAPAKKTASTKTSDSTAASKKAPAKKTTAKKTTSKKTTAKKTSKKTTKK